MQQATPVRIPPKDRVASPVQTQATCDDPLAQLQDQFEKLKAQVRQAQQLSSLGTAAAMIAHEVNNLLTPIFNYARMAQDSDDLELKNKALRVTVNNTEMLIAMSDRILKISAAAPPKRDSITMRQLVHDAIASLCRDFDKDSIRVSIDTPADLAVFVDALQMQQVLFNLLLNARESLVKSGGGMLRITASKQGDRVQCEIRNGGEPIPEELIQHIFEPFQSSKVSSSTDQRRCSGLGLALCRDLVEENGGTIAVESAKASGTVFRMTFPATN